MRAFLMPLALLVVLLLAGLGVARAQMMLLGIGSQGSGAAPTTDFMLVEDATFMLNEDGTRMCDEAAGVC